LPFDLSARAVPKIARLFDSVPPLVKMISLGFAPRNFAAGRVRHPAKPALFCQRDARSKDCPKPRQKRQHRVAHLGSSGVVAL
jgi:hypothetical protein